MDKQQKAGRLRRWLVTAYGLRWQVQILVYLLVNHMVVGVTQIVLRGDIFDALAPLTGMSAHNPLYPYMGELVDDILANALLCLALLLAYRLMNHAGTLSGAGFAGGAKKALRLSLGGWALGALAIGLVAAAMLLAPGMRFTAGNASALLLPYLLMFISVSFAEELLTRGVLQHTLTRHAHPWAGILGPSLFFGLMHINNEGIGWLALINIILAGLALALLCDITGSLYAPIGFHTAWNMVQANVLGLPVSGNDMSQVTLWRGLADAGPDWLSGGSFGPEASLYATAIYILLIAALLIRRARHRPRLATSEQ